MTIDNTSADRDLNALGVLAMGEAYILGQEAAGQHQLVNSTSLPSKGPTDEMTALGFTFGEPDKNDPLFRPATLPEGWRKEGSDHAMWSYVVDELGRRRVSVFYKAAFYDREAFMSLETVCSYARKLIYDNAMPVYDDAWCTREAFAEQVAKLRAELVKRIDEAKELAASRADDYWPRRASELTDDLAKHGAWAAKVEAAD